MNFSYGFNDRRIALGLKDFYLKGKGDRTPAPFEPFENRNDTPVSIENRTGETIPAYSCVFLTAVFQVIQNGDDFSIVYGAVKPGDASGGYRTLLTSGQDIPDGEIGQAQTGMIQRARIEQDPFVSPGLGDPIGPKDGEFFLTDDKPIYFPFRYLTANTTGDEIMVLNQPVLEFVGKPVLDVMPGGSATIDIYRDGTEIGKQFENVQLDWMHGDQQISAEKRNSLPNVR